MSELSAYYENFRVYASCGSLHTARCGGWHLSEVDTWHACGVCNPAGRNHPEDDRADDVRFEAEEAARITIEGGPPSGTYPVLVSDPNDDLPF